MSGSITRRIQTLEDRAGGPELARLITFVAAANDVSEAVVIAEAEHLLRETGGMTEAEQNERLARELGKTVAEVETARAEVAEEFAAWRERTT